MGLQWERHICTAKVGDVAVSTPAGSPFRGVTELSPDRGPTGPTLSSATVMMRGNRRNGTHRSQPPVGADSRPGTHAPVSSAFGSPSMVRRLALRRLPFGRLRLPLGASSLLGRWWSIEPWVPLLMTPARPIDMMPARHAPRPPTGRGVAVDGHESGKNEMKRKGPRGQEIAVLALLVAASLALSGLARAHGAPVTPALGGVTAIATNGNSDFACALSGGSVWCWGENEDGQLGDGSETTRTKAVQVKEVSGATTFAVGSFHACAIVKDGKVICWGDNSHGELGGGTDDDELKRATVVGISGATSVAAGEGWTCAVAGGKLWCWGDGYPNADEDVDEPGSPTAQDEFGDPLSLGLPLTRISGSLNELCGIAVTAAVCFGDEISEYSDAEIDDEAVAKRTIGSVELAVSDFHACARLGTGRVRCWGSNDEGELGDGTTDDRGKPVDVGGLTGAVSIATDAGRSCAVSNGGKVSCWGLDLGSKPRQQTSFPKAASVAVGSRFQCVVASGSGEVWCAGENDLGQLGNGTTKSSSKPVRVIKT